VDFSKHDFADGLAKMRNSKVYFSRRRIDWWDYKTREVVSGGSEELFDHPAKFRET
jgi:hypothetical protein